MDCLIAIGTWVAGKVADYAVAPVGHQLGYIFHYRSNIGNLITETQDLNLEKKRMEDLVDAARRNGEEVHNHIKDWLSKVGDITQQTEKLLGDENHTTINCTSRRPFQNLVQRYQLSRKAKKMGESVFKIKGDISFDNIASRPILQSNFRNNEFIKFDTRKEITRRIMEMLEDGNIKMIGMHGLPGAGKTTLVKEIAREASERKLFNYATVITVSQTPNLKSIQQAIAERLGLNLDKDIISERALLLENRLKSEEKFLIILDDLWNKELNLKDLGILIESDDQKGIKILLTSRFEPVLRGDFCVENTFRVELLSENEAWYLFSQIVGDLVKNDPDFQQHGNDIVKECARLPIAIVTIAHVLKNGTLPLWRDVLGKLRRSNLNIKDMHEKVYYPIRLCYDYVSEEAKLLSLLCCLHEEDESISMENLMRYGIGLGIFEGVPTLQEARDRVYSLVDELKGRCLLLDNDGMVGKVKMHDVIRDVAISIGKERHIYRFRDGAEVEEYKKRKTLEDSRQISLPNGYVGELVCESFEYKQLQLIWMGNEKFFWMQDDNKSLDIISKNFFEKTKEVRVLCFFGQNLVVLPPSSLCLLQNLHTLCMNRCELGDIALIGELKSLEILDLSGSSIKELPRKIGQLTRLRILDLSRCKDLIKVIHPNILSRLTRLEELMLLDFKNWDKDVDVVNGEIRNASLLELKDLVRLTHLELRIPDIRMLPKDLFSDQLKRYKIFIQIDRDDIYDIDYGLWSGVSPSRYLAISKCNESIILQEYGLETLLKRCDALYLSGLQCLNNIVYELHKKGFPELKMFCLKNNDTVQYLINTMGQITCSSVFGSLEVLSLVNLTNLEKICHGELIVESFKRLSGIRVTECKRLKNLLPFSIATQLEKIEITDCEMMEEICHGELRGESFKRLSAIRVTKCKRLKNLLPFSIATQLEKIDITDCEMMEEICHGELRGESFKRLSHIRVTKCKRLKNLLPFSIATQLEKIEITDCEMMEEIFTHEIDDGEMVGEFTHLCFLKLENSSKLRKFCSKLKKTHALQNQEETLIVDSSMPFFNGKFVSFPKLETLEMTGCDFTKIWDDQFQLSSTSFRNLTKLVVESCNFMENLFSSAMAASLEQLYSLDVRNCRTMKEIMRRNESMDKMSFPKLNILDLDNLPNLVSFSSSIFIEFPVLPQLYIMDCPAFKTFISDSSEHNSCTTMPSLFNEKAAFPSLNRLAIEYECEMVEKVGVRPSMVMISQDLLTADTFWKLKEINVHGCKSLTKMFSSNILRSLQNLSKLVISNCEMLEVVFEFQISNDHRHEMLEVTVPIHLTELELLHLPNLKHVWGNDPRGTFTFQDLQRLSVDECQCLKILFPTSVAKNLLQLQSLDVRNCGIEQIVAEEKGQNETIPTFVFPQLDSLTLHNLPRLMSFYPGLHTLKWPKLRWLEVSSFMKAEDLSLKFLRFQQTSGLIHHHISFQEPLFSIDEVTSSSQNEDLVGDQEECAGALSRLSVLRLYDMPNLLHLREESSQPQTVFQNLIHLDILRCGRIKKLVPSSISFQNLETLIVRQCHGMPSLLTSRTARSMARLKSLIIFNCKRMEEIIGDAEEGEDMEGEIVLARLKTLVLDCLPSLTCFYSGKYMLGLPDLENVIVSGCFEMLSFSKHGNIVSTPKLHKLVTACEYRVLFDQLAHLLDAFGIDRYAVAVNDTITAVNTPMDLNTIIPELWKSHPGTALQQLFCEKDLALSNLSVEQSDI